ncbi:MAG: cobalamin-independent methionine synthase II family protein [Verrucomicrobiota bacterium]|nr:cobalamin-independent methionine synthase II family protein [Verrucomicrobiota bacterium]
MKTIPLRTSVIGSYPFPSWLHFAGDNLNEFGSDDIEELKDDATICAIHDQTKAGLDVITDGEQTRFDFNLSFYGHLSGISLEPESPRKFGPPAHDQRGKHEIIGELTAPNGLGAVEEFRRLKRLAPLGQSLKMSVPGPFTMSGRLIPNERYPERFAITEALLPIISKELEALVAEGCEEICIDEPSMSCYGYKEDTDRFVEIFNRTVDAVQGKTRLCTHLCFGNFKGHAVGYRSYKPLFPSFLNLNVNEMHLEMANREYAELEIISEIPEKIDVAVGIVDVKSYFIEPVDLLESKIKECLNYVNAERLVLTPDCGLSQTARWAAKKKLINMCEAARNIRDSL